jgi:hypothetical protein
MGKKGKSSSSRVSLYSNTKVALALALSGTFTDLRQRLLITMQEEEELSGFSSHQDNSDENPRESSRLFDLGNARTIFLARGLPRKPV